MKDWHALPPDDELERADSLLDQADALLRRHRMDDRRPDATTPDWPASADLDDADLPILTEIVEGFALPADLPPRTTHPSTGFERPPPSPPPWPNAPVVPTIAPAPTVAATTQDATALQDALSARLAERLVELDTEIAREIGNWIAAEMPQILARELDQLATRLQTEMQSHLRATLLPSLSARVGSLLDQAAAPVTRPDRPLDN